MTAGTTSPPTRAWGLVSSSLLALTLALTGCATVAAAPTGDATPTATDATPTPTLTFSPVSGEGPTEFPGVAFVIPDDARSVVIDFECTGGAEFRVELGDSMALGQATLPGTCDGTTSLTWPITEQTQHTLGVVIGEGIAWTATPTFSTDEFETGAALAADCARFGEVHSALFSADTGYTFYKAIDAAEWRTRVDQAAADLADLAASAKSDFGEQFALIEASVSDPAREVGVALTDDVQQPFDEIRRACDTNHTPPILISEFGG